jgi:hypothetical protein
MFVPIWPGVVSAVASMQAAAAAQCAANAKAEHDRKRMQDEYDSIMANRASNGTVIEGEFEVIGEQKQIGNDL